MKYIIYYWCLVCTLIFSQWTAAAEDAKQAAAQDILADDQSNVAQSIAGLASDRFTERRAAFIELWRGGQAVTPWLEGALKSPDRRVAEAAAILQMLRDLDVAPGQHQESVQLLELLSNPGVPELIALSRLGHWTVVERLLRTNSTLSQRILEPYGRYTLGRMVEQALEQGNPELAWPTVHLAVSKNVAAWIAHKAQLALPTEDAETRAWKRFFEGDVEAASSEQLSAPGRLPMLTRSGQWPELLEPQIERVFSGGFASAANAASRAVLLEAAGEWEASEEAWRQLLASEPKQASATEEQRGDESEADQQRRALELLTELAESGRPELVNQFMVALILSGRARPVEMYLQDSNPTAAYGFLLAGGDYAAAFGALGLSADLSNFDSWLAGQRKTIEVQLASRSANREGFDQASRLCSALIGLGYPQQAEKLAQELVALARQTPTDQAELWRRSFLNWMGRSESRKLARSLVIDSFSELPHDAQMAVLETLYPEFGSVGLTLLATAPSGQGPPGWEELERLWLWDRDFFGKEAQSLVASWLRRATGELDDDELTSDGLSALAQVATGFGLHELAVELLSFDLTERIGQANASNVHWLDLADMLVDGGKSEEALSYLQHVRQSGLNVQRAYLKQVDLLLARGRFDEAWQIDQARWLRPLATTRFYQGLHYAQVGRSLADAGESEYGLEYTQAAFLLSDAGSMDAFWAASDYAGRLEELGDHAGAADVLRAALLESLQPLASAPQYLFSNHFHSSFRFAAQKERLYRAVACIERGELTEAESHMRVGAQLHPQDIEMVVQCYPRLREAGELEQADNLFAAYEQRMLDQLQRWPRDASALNNLAWMYARCDRALEKGMSLSRRAVELAPTSAVFLDTLAELEFRSGLREQAIATMRHCVRLDPREVHYRENLIRFRTPDGGE